MSLGQESMLSLTKDTVYSLGSSILWTNTHCSIKFTRIETSQEQGIVCFVL